MKKLIPLQGKGIKGILEITDRGTSLRPNIDGQLWLYGGALAKAEDCTDFGRVTGAVVIKDGAAVMWGGIGSGENAGRIIAEAIIRSKPLPANNAAPEAHPQQAAEVMPEKEAESEPNPPGGELKRPANPGTALLEILKKAEELFPPQQTAPQARHDRGTILNPFPEAFPFSRWHSREYPGTNRYYLEGEWLKDGITYMVYAIPGEFRGRRHRGFPRFIRSRDGSGYWVKIQRKQS